MSSGDNKEKQADLQDSAKSSTSSAWKDTHEENNALTPEDTDGISDQEAESPSIPDVVDLDAPQNPEQDDIDIDVDEEPPSGSKASKVSKKTDDVLQAKLAGAEHEAKKNWELAVRAKAELENVKRRASLDVKKAHQFGTEKLLKELLPVVDSLERGIENSQNADTRHESMHEGLDLTLKLLQDVLQKFGVVPLDPQGEAFDPTFHEAMTLIESKDVEAGTILSVIQKGYLLHDRLVRPARVVVAKTSTPKVDETA